MLTMTESCAILFTPTQNHQETRTLMRLVVLFTSRLTKANNQHILLIEHFGTQISFLTVPMPTLISLRLRRDTRNGDLGTVGALQQGCPGPAMACSKAQEAGKTTQKASIAQYSRLRDALSTEWKRWTRLSAWVNLTQMRLTLTIKKQWLSLDRVSWEVASQSFLKWKIKVKSLKQSTIMSVQWRVVFKISTQIWLLTQISRIWSQLLRQNTYKSMLKMILKTLLKRRWKSSLISMLGLISKASLLTSNTVSPWSFTTLKG